MHLNHILSITILDEVRHKWYTKTVKDADINFKFVTGVEIDTLLKRFVRRESEEDFKQRATITQQITPAIANKINKAFKKIHRTDNIIRAIKFSDPESAEKARLEDLISRYRAGKSLNKYLIKAFDRYNMIDPNAFLVNSFEPSEDRSQPNQPLGIEFISFNVLNYEYKNDILQWIILRDFVDVPGETELIPRYQMLTLTGQTIVSPIPKEDPRSKLANADKEITEDTEVIKIDNQAYEVTRIETEPRVIPAVPFGFKEDLATNGETFVTIWHEAIAYFWKSLKVVSEFDLTTALVAFPLRSQYVGACNAEGCNKGQLGNGKDCKVCDGLGLAPIVTSVQEVLTLKLPEEGDSLSLPDISNLSSVEGPPVDIVKFQQEYIKAIEEDAIGAIFNSDIFSKNSTVQTATEVSSKRDNINDPLLGYADGFSEIWKFVVRSVAVQAGMNVDDLTVAFEFPKDFRFETLDDLIALFKEAVTSNAPSDIKGSIAKRLAKKEFVDDPGALTEFEAKQKLNPFPDENADEIQRKIAVGLVTDTNAFIWANLSDLLCQIKIDDPDFFFKDISEQKDILRSKAEELDTRNPQFDVNTGG